MDRETELGIVRRAYAKQIMAAAGVRDRRVENAFAAVRREDFLGRGPWPILRWSRGYVPSPSADPTYLYADVLIGIVPERNLNNGEPSFLARLIASAAPRPGEHVVHVGAGVGYYTAILAHLVGRRGRITAIEYDAELAGRAADNLAGQTNVRVMEGDGARVPFEPADAILVNAGATRPAESWLDGLRDGGRLILPLPRTDFRIRISAAARCFGSPGKPTISRRSGSPAWRFSRASACGTRNRRRRSRPRSRRAECRR